MRKLGLLLVALALFVGIAHEAQAAPFLGLGIAGRGLARGLRGRGARGLVGRSLGLRGLRGGLGVGGLGVGNGIFRNRGLFINRGLIGRGIYNQAAFAAPIYQQQAILRAPIYQQQAILRAPVCAPTSVYQAPVCAPAAPLMSYAQEEVIQQQAFAPALETPGCGCGAIGAVGAGLAYPGGLLRQRGIHGRY